MATNPQMLIRIAANLQELRRNLAEGKVSIETTTAAMTKLAGSLDGSKLEQRAHNIVAAINQVGGASKLSDAEAARLNRTLTEYVDKATRMGKDIPPAILATRDALQRTTETTQELSTALSVAAGVLASQFIMKASSAIVSYGKEALMTSARVETLGGVARFMGQQAGYSAAQIDALSAALQKQGITSAQSYDTITQLVRANLGLADAQRLATVAQSLARATGENSSATLNKLIQGTQTLQVEVLRNAGVVIQLDQEYKKFAQSADRTVQSLSAQEKQQIALSAVLREGERVAGVYGVTNEFVGGKIQSMARHQEEAAKAIGDVFKPALKLAVDVFTEFLKIVKEAPALFGALGVAAVSAATYLTTFKAAAALGVISTSTLTAALGLLWPAVAVGATAFGAWKFGEWIGGVTRLTDGVEWLTGRMMGLSTAEIMASRAAREWASSAEGAAETARRRAEALASLPGVRVVTGDDTAQRAAEATKKHAAELEKLAAAGRAAANEMGKLADSFLGFGAISTAERALEALNLNLLKGFTISQMADAEQKKLHATMAAGIDTYRRLGMEAPEAMVRIANETRDLSFLTAKVGLVDLKTFKDGFDALPKVAVPSLSQIQSGLKATDEEMELVMYRLAQFVEELDKTGKTSVSTWDKTYNALGDVNTILTAIPGKIAEVGAMAARAGQAIMKNLADGNVWGAVVAGATAAIGILGKLFNIGQPTEYEKRVRANAEAVQKLTAEAIAAAGGMDRLRDRAAIVGIQIDEAFRSRDATWIEQVLGDVEERTQRLTAAMEKYGISWEDLGERARQSKINQLAEDLILDFEVLMSAGADVNLIIERMGDSILEFVAMAARTGTEVPAAMKPMLQRMIDMGLLVDENGNAFGSLEESGIQFAETMTAGFDRIVDAIDRIAKALGYVFSEFDGRSINIGTTYSGGSPPPLGGTNRGEFDIQAASGFHGWVHGPTRILAGEGGRSERVDITPASGGDGGMMQPIVLNIEGEQVLTALVRTAKARGW